LERRDRFHEEVLVPEVVTVQERDILAFGELEPLVASMGHTLFEGVEYHLESLVQFKTPKDVLRTIG